MKRSAWLLLTALLLGLMLASLAFGELRLSLSDIWAGLRGTDTLAHTVLWNLRLPRTLVAIAVGAGLAASGAVMQALFRNPLASPDLLGVSRAARWARSSPWRRDGAPRASSPCLSAPSREPSSPSSSCSRWPSRAPAWSGSSSAAWRSRLC